MILERRGLKGEQTIIVSVHQDPLMCELPQRATHFASGIPRLVLEVRWLSPLAEQDLSSTHDTSAHAAVVRNQAGSCQFADERKIRKTVS